MADSDHASRDPLNPPDQSFGMTFRHLLALWREEWRLGSLGLACAFAFTIVSLALPHVVQRAIDHSIVPRKPDRLWPPMAVILARAPVPITVNITPRYATSRIGLLPEARRG